MNYWLIKQEPEEFSWADLEREGKVVWDGVRNYQARNNLKAMELDDFALFYHSVTGKQVMGIAQVSQTAFPDPTSPEDDRWVSVIFKPYKALNKPVELQRIKSTETLSKIALIKQSRLSVMPLTQEEFEIIVEMGNEDKDELR